MRYLIIRKNRFCCLLLSLILTAFISFSLAMTVPASSPGTPEAVPTDGTYIEGTITPVEENSFSGESPAGLYPFTLSDAGLVQMHFITHANQVLRIKVIDADENQLLDAWLDSMASPGDYSFYLDPGSYSVCVYSSYADTSGDYRFFLKETSLHMPPENIVCDQSYEGFFHSSSDDTIHEQHSFRLTASAPISSIECSSTAGLELTIRDLNENVLYSMITDNGRQEELQLPPGEYLLMVESFGIAGEYSFYVHTAGTSDENGSDGAPSSVDPSPDHSDNTPAAGTETDPAAGSETGSTAVFPLSDQPSGTDPATISKDDESRDDESAASPDDNSDESAASPKAKGPVAWLKENLLSPETFIGAIVVGVLVNKISDLLSKKKD